MPTIIVDVNRIGAGIQVTLLAGQNVYVPSGIIVGSTENQAIAGTTDDHDYRIDGDVFGDYMGILNTDDASSGNKVTVGVTGTVGATFHSGIYLAGSDHMIVNYGQISGTNGITMYTIGTSTDSVIINYGVVNGEFYGIGRQNTNATEKLVIKNYGTISGGTSSFDYSAGNAIEQIANNGIMVGDVQLGLNNDLYDGRKGTVDGDVFGGDGNDTLYGGAGDEALDGGANDDVLMGGAGADDLIGGTGSDRISYISASSGVTVNLAKPNLNTGDARGDSFSSIEDLTGSRFNDTLFRTSGTNIINGADGADQMEGGAGSDRYYVDNAGDVVVEANVSGTDRVVSTGTFSLSGQYIERLTLSGTDDINGTGNSLANEITGNAGNNILNGSSGNDTLTGGDGDDTFVFSNALVAANVDTITDFVVADDVIHIDNAVFAGLATGALAAGAFTANAAGTAGDSGDRIIYETDTGRLYFDADGTGAGARVHFATLDPGLAVTNADFVVI